MGITSEVHGSGQRIVLASAVVITTAVTATVTTPIKFLTGMSYLVARATFTYGSGGTTAKFWVQTSYDGGLTWADVMNFAFTTATADKLSAVNTYTPPTAQATAQTDGTLADNTVYQGALGNAIRLKYTTTGTYAGSTSISINAIAKD